MLKDNLSWIYLSHLTLTYESLKKKKNLQTQEMNQSCVDMSDSLAKKQFKVDLWLLWHKDIAF